MILNYPVKIKKSQLIKYPAAVADKQLGNLQIRVCCDGDFLLF